MQEKPSLNLFSMDIAHPIFILILVAAGVKLASVWLRLEKAFPLVLVFLFSWKVRQPYRIIQSVLV